MTRVPNLLTTFVFDLSFFVMAVEMASASLDRFM
jgi:hypothetical protein